MPTAVESEIKVNIGCGLSGISGWVNIDNSPTLLLRRVPVLRRMMKTPDWPADVRRYDVIRRRLPFSDGTVQFIYSSHTFEHFTYDASQKVARECFRVLQPGGVLRIAVPDLAKLVADYLRDPSALASHTFISRLLLHASVYDLLRAGAHHQQMFDARSLCHMLREASFSAPERRRFRDSRIPEINALELEERRGESLYVECVR
jgi:predicted SAM-dependent methyltransferase